MSGDPSYFTDRSHVLISGVSGSRTDYGGKTALAVWWAANYGRRDFDLTVFCNFKQDDVAEHFDVEVGSVQELATAMADGERHIVLTPDSPDWEATHERLEGFIRELPQGMTKLVVHDEAPEYDEKPLLSFVRVHGNGANCKSLVIAQSPTDLSTSVRNQCIPCWVGPATEQNRHYFRANHYENHFEHILDAHDPYHWTVITGPGDDDRDHYGPVSEDYA